MAHVEERVNALTPLQDLLTLARIAQTNKVFSQTIQKNLSRELADLETVGLSWTMLSEISNLPDANERLACIPWIVQAIVSGQVSLTVVGDRILFSGAGKTASPRASNEPDITVLIRIH